MRLLILFALILSLQADDKPAPCIGGEHPQNKPNCIPASEVLKLPTVEQLQAQIAAKDQQIAKLQRKLTIYQESAFRCQDAMLDAQIEAQQKQHPPTKEAK